MLITNLFYFHIFKYNVSRSQNYLKGKTNLILHFLFQGYSVRSIENNNSGSSGPIYMTLSFAGVALMAAMVVGIVVMKKRSGRHPHHQVCLILMVFELYPVIYNVFHDLIQVILTHLPYNQIIFHLEHNFLIPFALFHLTLQLQVTLH